MKLKIGNLVVQPLQYEELAYVKAIRDQALDYLETQVSYTLEQTQEWFTRTTPKWYSISIGKDFIGYIRTSDFNKVSRSIYVGIDIAEDYRGSGYAYQVYQEFLHWLNITGHLHALLRVQVKNYRAYNLYRKLGFRTVGVLEDFVITPTGNSLDVIIMQKKL